MCQLNCFKYFNEQSLNYLSEVFNVATESNIQLRGSFQKLKCPFHKSNNGQFALSYIGLTFWNKNPETLKRTNNLYSFIFNYNHPYFFHLCQYSLG